MKIAYVGFIEKKAFFLSTYFSIFMLAQCGILIFLRNKKQNSNFTKQMHLLLSTVT